ncbi:beta-N-acetylhexosaminidase [Flavihumibacter fluvii]|uniref:beta-N-acetylhexosaminidase n=1 Tax=Flavihumibacter fluvii TaxID=2838157 RepID=UPI001BDF40CD|nr:beta-N-acetylhexosaminidase [Flavihumibacter fluvii]ULQ52136.1 beta-N-acetylhexosaminidase [Flavihumibacter fluvii]
MMWKPSILAAFVLCVLTVHISQAQQNQVSPEKRLLPVPQKVAFSGQQFILDESWTIVNSNVPVHDPALLSLVSELKARYGIAIPIKKAGKSKPGNKTIVLQVKAGAVDIGPTIDSNRTALKKQAYHLTLQQQNIVITANAPQGLFYGVQTLLQSLEPTNGKTYFTTGDITDWPDMDLRIIYWDDAHHLERPEAMKRAIRQASYYKVSGFALKLEGHFEFASAKPIVEPYAYSAKELQELTDYARSLYIELIPFLDAPAHIAFILKHPEYKDLRAFPNSNYDLSVVNPKADALILNMMDDLFAANKGGNYVVFSTDEAYYTGKAPGDKQRAAALGGNGKLLAEYITRIGNQLHQRGRKVIIWTEHPMKKEDIKDIPSHIISGVYSEDWAPVIKAHGMRQLVYTATQGVEPLFPTYYPLAPKELFKDFPPDNYDEEQQSMIAKGRVGEMLAEITNATTAGKADFMGVFVAGWADAGLNPETFWLGYATGAAAGWKSKATTAADLMTRFYHSFYTNSVEMEKTYRLLSTQAEFWGRSWQLRSSNNRVPIFGNSEMIYPEPKPAKDQTLPLLPVPSPTDLSLKTDWNSNNAVLLEDAAVFLKENNELMDLLQANLSRESFQAHHLLVLQSVAQLCRQNLHMLLDLEKINDYMQLAAQAGKGNPEIAVAMVDAALDKVKDIRNHRNEVLQSVTATWYQEWFPKVAEANGRKFLHQADDVKDHYPDRTIDMSYLVYRQLKYPLGTWANEALAARNQFAKQHGLPERTAVFNWDSITAQ